MVLTEAIAMMRLQGATMLRSALAGDEQLDQSEMATPDDHGLFGPASSAWRVHSDAAMLIGGLRALMLQTLHPLAMAGVSQHSDYRTDPWGRLHRTGRFVGATTFGSTATAEKWIAIVRRVHDRVQGTAPDGRPYSANDPHLLLWVHVTEVDSFLSAFERFGKGKLTDAEKDSYVNEMAEVAERLGSEKAPRTRAELDATMEMFRAECEYTDTTKETVRFLLRPPVPLATAGAYGLISAGAVTLLPSWARTMLRLPMPPGADLFAIRPAATVLTRGLGWLLSAPENMRLDDNMLSSTAKTSPNKTSPNKTSLSKTTSSKTSPDKTSPNKTSASSKTGAKASQTTSPNKSAAKRKTATKKATAKTVNKKAATKKKTATKKAATKMASKSKKSSPPVKATPTNKRSASKPTTKKK